MILYPPLFVRSKLLQVAGFYLPLLQPLLLLKDILWLLVLKDQIAMRAPSTVAAPPARFSPAAAAAAVALHASSRTSRETVVRRRLAFMSDHCEGGRPVSFGATGDHGKTLRAGRESLSDSGGHIIAGTFPRTTEP